MEKQTLQARRPHRTTAKQLAANRVNAQKAGRPAGGMNADKIALRDKCRAYDDRNISILARIAADEAAPHSARISAIGMLLERAHGRPPQPIDGDGVGGPISIEIITQVPGPDD